MRIWPWLVVVPLVLGACKRRSPPVVQESDTDTDTDPNPNCQEDADEPVDGNDDFGAAIPIPGDNFNGALVEASSVDFYTFDANMGDAIVVSAQFQHAVGDIDITVYRPNMAQVTDGTSATDADEEIVSSSAQETGTHFVRLSYPGDTACVDYTMSVNVGP